VVNVVGTVSKLKLVFGAVNVSAFEERPATTNCSGLRAGVRKIK
jgi:hypothetical protein